MKKLNILILLLMVSAMIISSCKHDDSNDTVFVPNTGGTDTATGSNDPCDSNIVYFEKDVLPILNSNCAMSGCHDPGTAKEGIVLNNYTNVMATGKITPMYAGSSKIYKAIIDNDPKDVMPPAPKSRLTDAQIAVIAKWINQGAKNITCNSSGNCDTVNITYSGTISKTINTYCVGCHGAVSPGAGIMLNTYAGVSAMAANGKLIGSIKSVYGFKPMPVGGKLDDCKIKQIQKWIDAGYPNN
jgi:mono/diheme cytochrome c family protein